MLTAELGSEARRRAEGGAGSAEHPGVWLPRIIGSTPALSLAVWGSALAGRQSVNKASQNDMEIANRFQCYKKHERVSLSALEVAGGVAAQQGGGRWVPLSEDLPPRKRSACWQSGELDPRVVGRGEGLR